MLRLAGWLETDLGLMRAAITVLWLKSNMLTI